MNSEEQQKCCGFLFPELRSAPGGRQAPASSAPVPGEPSLSIPARPSLQGLAVMSGSFIPNLLLVSMQMPTGKRSPLHLHCWVHSHQTPSVKDLWHCPVSPGSACVHANPSTCCLLPGQMNVHLPSPPAPQRCILVLTGRFLSNNISTFVKTVHSGWASLRK